MTHGVGDVIDHNSGLSSSVVHRCQAVVAFLSSGVPDLKLHCRIIQTYRLCEKRSWKKKKKKHKTGINALIVNRKAEETQRVFEQEPLVVCYIMVHHPTIYIRFTA